MLINFSKTVFNTVVIMFKYKELKTCKLLSSCCNLKTIFSIYSSRTWWTEVKGHPEMYD